MNKFLIGNDEILKLGIFYLFFINSTNILSFLFAALDGVKYFRECAWDYLYTHLKNYRSQQIFLRVKLYLKCIYHAGLHC